MNTHFVVAALAACLVVSAPRAQESVSSVESRASGESGELPATVLLITAEELRDAFGPFAEWKADLGLRTEIVTVAELRERFDAPSAQESIRLSVRHYIEERGTRFVVLGGDSAADGGGLVPGGHRTYHRAEPDGIPTDIVYLSPTDWDADGDGRYGEFDDDREAITYPDGTVGLGRIPVRTVEDVHNFTEKVIAYERDYPTDGFAERMVYTCTDSPAYPKVRRSWDGYLQTAWPTGSVERFFSQETPWDGDESPGSFPLSPENLVGLVNEGRVGKLHLHGHGHLPAFMLETGAFDASHVSELTNRGAYPLITTVSCNTGEYDGRQDPSIVEALLRAKRAGSVAVVAPIRTGKPHFHSPRDFRAMVQEGKLDGTTQTMTRYWVHGLGGGAPTGLALMQAKVEMVADALRTDGFHLCICELNLLGDPTLSMRAGSPTRPRLEVVETRTRGAETSALTVRTDPGATAVLRGEGVYEVQIADEEGGVAFETRFAESAEMRVTVSGPRWNAVSVDVSVNRQQP